jgi:hypothetical protein
LKERRAQTAEQLRKAGKPVPEQLLRKIEQDKIDVEQNDVYNKKVTFQTPIVQPQPQHMQPPQHTQPQHMQPPPRQPHHMQPPPRPPQHMQQPPRPPPRPLSQQQPKVKPRATASARVGLGGVY